MPKEQFLTIDFGTSGIKCMLFTPEGNVQARQFVPIHYIDSEGLFGIGKEFDAPAAWQTICQMIPRALKEAKSKPADITSIAATSQRHGAVFLDKKGGVIYAGPNLDARGVLIQDSVLKGLIDACPPTGCWPPLLYSLCRLLWYKREKPELFSKIEHVLSISDWIVYQFTGKATTDPTQASNTQLMDIRSSQWSPEILEMAELSVNLLPEICEPGTVVGTVSAAANKSTGLSKASQVSIGGADTQCALLGSSATQPGDVTVVAGNTGPIQLVTSKPLIDPTNRLWTGRFLLPRKWVLEANCGPSGSVLTWFIKNIIVPLSSKLAEPTAQAFTCAEQLASEAPVGSFDTVALLGPQIMDATDMTTVRPSIFLFPPPTSPVLTPISIKEISRALFENICYAIRINLERIQNLAQCEFKKCSVAGGMTRSSFWLQMLADVTGLNIQCARVVEASSLGAAICAATAAGFYKSLTEAARHMVYFQSELVPRKEIHNKYNTYFSRWQTLYNQSTNL
ncbi:MAG: FGGY-family carbohydrate kinase [Candidatus Thorarchaeota archaeon]